MNVIKLLGQSTTLSDTPSNIGGATRVLVQHDHNAGQAHLMTLKNAGGTTLGSMLISPSHDYVLEKEATDTLEVATGITDISVTSVSHLG